MEARAIPLFHQTEMAIILTLKLRLATRRDGMISICDKME